MEPIKPGDRIAFLSYIGNPPIYGTCISIERERIFMKPDGIKTELLAPIDRFVKEWDPK